MLSSSSNNDDDSQLSDSSMDEGEVETSEEEGVEIKIKGDLSSHSNASSDGNDEVF